MQFTLNIKEHKPALNCLFGIRTIWGFVDNQILATDVTKTFFGGLVLPKVKWEGSCLNDIEETMQKVLKLQQVKKVDINPKAGYVVISRPRYTPKIPIKVSGDMLKDLVRMNEQTISLLEAGRKNAKTWTDAYGDKRKIVRLTVAAADLIENINLVCVKKILIKTGKNLVLSDEREKTPLVMESSKGDVTFNRNVNIRIKLDEASQVLLGAMINLGESEPEIVLTKDGLVAIKLAGAKKRTTLFRGLIGAEKE